MVNVCVADKRVGSVAWIVTDVDPTRLGVISKNGLDVDSPSGTEKYQRLHPQRCYRLPPLCALIDRRSDR